MLEWYYAMAALPNQSRLRHFGVLWLPGLVRGFVLGVLLVTHV